MRWHVSRLPGPLVDRLLNNRAASERNPAQEKSHDESPPLNIHFQREIKQPVAL